VVVNPFRRQLPVRSPLTAGAVAGAVLDVARPGSDPKKELCALLRDRYGAGQVTLYGSGTQALAAVLRAAAPEGESSPTVALPGFACYDVATAAIAADCRIRLYDLDPNTLAPDWDSVRRALEAGARILVLAPLYGYPFDWSPAEALAREHGAALVEDAAQAAGGEWEGTSLGSFGSRTVLSFGRGKGWTGGHGGALLERGGAVGERVTGPPASGNARALAVALALLLVGRPSLYGLPHALPWLYLGETRFREPSPERGMPAMAAALALRSEPLLHLEVERRRENARVLGAALEHLYGVETIRYPAGATPGFLRLPVRCRRIRQSLPGSRALSRAGVEAGYPTTLAALEPVRSRLEGSRSTAIRGSEALVRELITFPTHGAVSERDMAVAVRELHTVLERTHHD
jgi:perosamine synthetase